MPETLKKWPGKHRSPKDPYPWSDWFNGQIVRLRQGRDYQIGTENFRGVIRSAARRLKKRVMTHTEDGGRSVVVQALTGGNGNG